MAAVEIRTGTVRRVTDKGGNRLYGFIAPDAGGKDIFFHVMDGRVFEPTGEGLLPTGMRLARAPRVKDLVVYVADDVSDRGPKARPWGFADGSDGAKTARQPNEE